MADEVVRQGAFYESLTRNNATIKRDRAESIAESTETLYKRTVEDLELKIKKLKRERDNALDLSGDNALSLKVAANFNEQKFVEDDLTIGVSIRNLEIKLEIAKERYATLFGGQ